MDPNNPVSRRNVLVGGLMGAVAFADRRLRERTVVPDSEALDGGSLGRASLAAPSAAASSLPRRRRNPQVLDAADEAAEGSSEAFWKEQMAAYTALTGTHGRGSGHSLGDAPEDVYHRLLRIRATGRRLPGAGFPGTLRAGWSDPRHGGGASGDDWQSAFRPDLWAGAVYIGKQWGPPNITSAPAFIWNKAHFQAAGLDPEVGRRRPGRTCDRTPRSSPSRAGSAGASASSSRGPKP